MSSKGLLVLLPLLDPHGETSDKENGKARWGRGRAGRCMVDDEVSVLRLAPFEVEHACAVEA